MASIQKGPRLHNLYFLPVEVQEGIITESVISESRSSSVCTAMGYGMEGRGSILDRSKFFLFSVVLLVALQPTSPPIQWELGATSSGVKAAETNHTLPCSAEVKMAEPTPQLPQTSSRHSV
jgi:hypothetical protein